MLVATLVVPASAQRDLTTFLDAVTTGNASTVDRRDSSNWVFFVEWSSGTSAGVVTIEEASSDTYTDTWSTLATVTWAAASETEAVHLSESIWGALRVRVSTTVVGGTVTVKGRGM